MLYTDVWVSMGDEEEREERMAVLPPYQVNTELVKRSENEEVLAMHCLPAHRGEEISDAVMDGDTAGFFRRPTTDFTRRRRFLRICWGA